MASASSIFSSVTRCPCVSPIVVSHGEAPGPKWAGQAAGGGATPRDVAAARRVSEQFQARKQVARSPVDAARALPDDCETVLGRWDAQAWLKVQHAPDGPRHRVAPALAGLNVRQVA